MRHEHFTESKDRLGPAAIAELCGDWRERYTLASGPGRCSTRSSSTGRQEGDPDLLDMERFQPTYGPGPAPRAEGGTVRFRVTDVDADLRDGRSDPGWR